MGSVHEEQIRAALEGMDREVLLDALALVLAEKKEPVQEVAAAGRPEFANFARAVLFLKNNYDFAELDLFSTEADLVYVNAGERRILLTDRSAAPQASFRKSEAEKPGGGEREADGGRFSHLEI